MNDKITAMEPRPRALAKQGAAKFFARWRRRILTAFRTLGGDLDSLKLEQALQRANSENAALKTEVANRRAAEQGAPMFVPPGHYYSAIPPLADVRQHASRLFDRSARNLPGIDLRETDQRALLEEFAGYYLEHPFPETKQPDRRYYFQNPAYSYSDALFLYGMIRHARPRRIIEVGSGFSSAATLDTNERFFGGSIECTFIEPYPCLHSLLSPTDRTRVAVLAEPLQNVPLDRFRALQANDILFIDSTHVSRIGSDVNYIVFEILPALAQGVFVHFHDIFHPFEYPEVWINEGRTWQEAYLLRAFLEFNDSFRVVAFNTFLMEHHRAWFEQKMPLCLKNPGGSIWLQRTEPAPRISS